MSTVQVPAAPPEAAHDPFLSRFDELEVTGRLQNPGWLFPARKAAISRYAESGLPTTQFEDWRFTNLAPLKKLPFHPVTDLVTGGVDGSVVRALTFGALDAHRLVFINGHFAADLSDRTAEPGLTLESFGDIWRRGDGHLLDRHLARQIAGAQNPFAALNTAFFQDGVLVHVHRGARPAKPVHLLFIATEPEGTSFPRVVVVAEEGSEAAIVESYATTGRFAHLTNAAVEVYAAQEAKIEHCRFTDESPQSFHIATLHYEAAAGSRVSGHSIALGSRISRANIGVRLGGESIVCVLNGLYVAKDEQLLDHYMVVEHAAPRCESHEYFNGILDDRSRGVFHGRILVRPEAQKTDAKQTNRNLLLSDDAVADAKPQLEIYADDVKCTHGATVGQLNDEAIFYLRARGIGDETARRMLIHAFAGEIVDRVQCAAVRDELDALVWARLEEQPHLESAALV